MQARASDGWRVDAGVWKGCAAMIRAWSVTDDEYPEDVGSVLVYAETRERARALGVAYIATDYENARATRAKYADHLATDERVERDDRVIRKLGWREEDSRICAACNLASYDHLPETAVCEECENCAECGHATGEHDGGERCSKTGHDCDPGDETEVPR